MAQAAQLRKNLTQPGILAALSAAFLFGSGTPLAKMLLTDVSPWLMAALLYLASGIGITLYRLVRKSPSVRLPRGEWPWPAGAIFTGGVLGPGLQMLGLTRMPASGASLLLNAETVFTALLAWFVFKENFDKRIALGMGAILAGLLILSWPGEAKFSGIMPALCVLGACFCWAVACRKPSKLQVLDTNTGGFVAKITTAGDADDIFYDTSRDRLYVIGGQGYVDVLHVSEKTKPPRLRTLPRPEGPEPVYLFLSGISYWLPHRAAERTLQDYWCTRSLPKADVARPCETSCSTPR